MRQQPAKLLTYTQRNLLNMKHGAGDKEGPEEVPPS